MRVVLHHVGHRSFYMCDVGDVRNVYAIQRGAMSVALTLCQIPPQDMARLERGAECHGAPRYWSECDDVVKIWPAPDKPGEIHIQYNRMTDRIPIDPGWYREYEAALERARAAMGTT